MRRRQLRGFSLLELTIAMAMVAMLALTLYTSMRVAIQARRSASASVASVRAATIAMDLVCSDLQSVLAPKGNYAGPFTGTRQSGTGSDADTLDFFSIGRDGDTAALDKPWSEGIREVTLLLNTDANPPNLVRRVTRNLQPKVQTDPDEEILCRGVRSLSIRYYDGTDWQEDWDSTGVGDILPVAVAITIELSDPNTTTPQTPNPANRITRIIPLACAPPSTSTNTGGSP
ncbi:MAG: type II secretion system protein GspJ [Tepidisphaeraceae bacterium]|jgi:general secretion pathway protein J